MADDLVKMQDQFRGLPMEDLIGGPLQAACDSQKMLASSMIDFITSVGMNPIDASDPAKGYKTRQVDFSMNRPNRQDDGTVTQEKVEMSVPTLAIVPIPNLQVDNVVVDFEMEVKSSFTEKKGVDTKVSVDASYGGGFWPVKVKIHGEVATHKETTRKSDNSAKYTVHVEARQQPPPEGLMKVLDILQTACEPVAVSNKSGGGTDDG
jgi:hypothetical protein